MNQRRSLSVLLNHTFKLFGSKFSVILIPLLIYGAIMGIIQMLMLQGVMDRVLNSAYISIYSNMDSAQLMEQLAAMSEELVKLIPYAIAALVVQIFAYPLVSGVIFTVQFSEIEGIKTDLKSAFQIAKKNYGRLLYSTVASSVIVLALIVAASLIVVLFSMFSPAIAPLLMLAVMFGTIMVVIALNYTLPMTMAKRIQGFAAVKHSFELMLKGGFGRNLGHLLLISLMLSFAVQIITSVFSAFVFMDTGDMILILQFIATLVAQLISGCFVVASGFMYINAQVEYDGRTRQQEI